MTRHVNQIRNFFAQMLSFCETLNRGLQRQKQRQTLNPLASSVLFIYKTKNPAVAVESEEERVLMVTGQPKNDYVTFQNALIIMHTFVVFPINKTCGIHCRISLISTIRHSVNVWRVQKKRFSLYYPTVKMTKTLSR